MLHRLISHQIIADLGFFPAVGIIGPRQVGKTTLAKYVQKQISPQGASPSGTFQADSIYLDLELDTDRRKLFDAETFLKYHQDKCVVIDEVQRMPQLLPLLRALIDIDRRPGRFILLGSASPDMIKGSSETLAGRIAYTELTPFSWLEVSDTVSMHDHWLKGGFPQALLAGKLAQTQRWLGQFIETFVQRDLRELGQQVSPPLVERMLEMIASLHAQILNQTDLGRSLGISQPTINRYLNLLEGGFIIQRLQPYFANVSKRIVKQPKIYIRDSGILHSMIGIHGYDHLLGHVSIGASWEGYVIEQIRRVAGGNWKFYFYRTHKGAESDLVLITPDGKKICIEIKRSASGTVSRGFYETLSDLQPDHRFVIIPDGDAYPKEQNIWVCSLDEFLKAQLPAIYALE